MSRREVTHVYRWDLDKTYLDTDFESLRGLARAATERPAQKINVPGSAALLRALAGPREDHRPWVAIVSGSPKQMRPVLEEKLRLDGVHWNELHLKNTLGQLRRGRLRAIRAQLGYKLPRLLRSRAALAPSSREILFGDDAESDALIYSLFAAICSGSLQASEVAELLQLGGVYEDTVERTLADVAALTPEPAVELMFIYLARPTAPDRFRPLGDRVIPIYSYIQAALVLGDQGQLPAAEVLEVIGATLGQTTSDAARRVANECQDLVRRGHLRRGYPAALRTALARTPTDTTDLRVLDECEGRLSMLSEEAVYRPPSDPVDPDWAQIVRSWVP